MNTAAWALLIVLLWNAGEVIVGIPAVATLGGLLTAAVRQAQPGGHVEGPGMLWLTRSGEGLPKDSVGTAIGLVLIVDRQHVGEPGWLGHESVHVRQWQRFGSFGMLAVLGAGYIVGLVRYRSFEGAYWHHPLEVEAYKAQFGSGWTPPV